DKPTSAQEQMEFARLCMFKKLTAASAHFFADAYKMSPELADDPDAGQRYNAACEAALAGCGQGEDASKLDDAERERLRTEARRWLNSELDRWAVAPNNNAKTRDAARDALTHWRDDPDLAGLREPDSLAKLSEPERNECVAFWLRLDNVLARLQENR